MNLNLITNKMNLNLKGVAVLTNAMPASGALISNILIGTKALPNQGLAKISGLPAFSFKSVRHYSRKKAFVAAVKGVYTYTPAISTTISNHSMRFAVNGFDDLRPNNDKNSQSVLVSVAASESLTNEQFCNRIVEAFSENRFFSAAVSGSGNSAVVLLTEIKKITPASKYPTTATIGVVNANSGSSFSKTTQTVAQSSYTGQELYDLIKTSPIKDMVVYNPNGVDLAANYDYYSIILDRRDIVSPYNYSNNLPFEYAIFVKNGVTNGSVFETKLNALFDITSGDFDPFVSENLAAIVAADTIAQSANYTFQDGDPIKFGSVGSVTGIDTNTIYYVVSAGATTFKVSATLGGSAIDLGGSNSNVTASLAWYAGDATADTLLAIPSMSAEALTA